MSLAGKHQNSPAGGGQVSRTTEGGGLHKLEDQVLLAAWPTPMAGTPAQKGYNEAGNNDSSRKTVALVTGSPRKPMT